MSKRYVLVAGDISPTNALTALGKGLENPEHSILSYFGKDQVPVLEGTPHIVESADLVIVGMSSTEVFAGSELVALKLAREAGVKYGFFSDMRNCWKGRTYFHPFAADASIVFVTRPDEVEEAQKHFPKAKIVAVGHPSREADMMPKVSREEARGRLGIQYGTKMILCVGTKLPAVNLALLKAAQDVAINLRGKADVKVVFSPHPKDVTTEAQYRDVFDHGVSIFADSKTFRSVDLLPGADMLVHTMSNMFYETAFLRIPNVCFMPDLVATERTRLLGVARPPEEAEGTMAVVCSLDELAGFITDLGSPYGSEVFREQRRQQELQYGEPQPAGTAVRFMVEAIAQLGK